MNAVATLAPQVGVVNACEVLGVARGSYYRYQARDDSPPLPAMRSRSPLALSEAERQQVLELLHSERFVDQAPPTVYATLLDEGQYLCSVRTMYRILAEAEEICERRNQRRHPA
jgi:putative transposase